MTGPEEAPILTVARQAYQAEKDAAESRRRDAEQREADREAEARATAIQLALSSPLPDWFPDQQFEYIGRYTDGVVVRAVGTDLMFCVTRFDPVNRDDQATWTVALVRPDLEPGKSDWLVRARRVDSPAAVGRAIEDRTNPAPETL